MKIKTESIKGFAELIKDLQHSDREIVIGVGGFKGEGKSTFDIQLLKAFSRLNGSTFNFNNITWSRKELITWIDGEENTQPGPDGLKPGQLPEYSGIIVDELFLLFYRRKWFEAEQIEGIATFNMHRDRHLFIIGNTPNFWDLDPGFQKQIRFYVYIPARGVAWVFEQENNPFTDDPWNTKENKRVFRKSKGPGSCPNFLFEVHFDDLSPEEKEVYLGIRNDKRLKAIQDSRPEKEEKQGKYKFERDELIKALYFDHNETQLQIGERIGRTRKAIEPIVAKANKAQWENRRKGRGHFYINTKEGYKPQEAAAAD